MPVAIAQSEPPTSPDAPLSRRPIGSPDRAAIAQLRDDEPLTAKRVAAILGVTYLTIKQWCGAGRFGRKVGGAWLITGAEVKKIAAERTKSRTRKSRTRKPPSPSPKTAKTAKTPRKARKTAVKAAKSAKAAKRTAGKPGSKK